MGIAYFITGLILGGAETVTVGIANEMAQRGHRVMILYMTGENAHAERIAPNVTVVGLNANKTPWGIAAAMIKSRKIINRFRPDVVHSNMVHANIFARILRFTTKMPLLISTEHTKNIGRRLRMLAYRLTDSLSDINTNVSQEALDFFIKTHAFKAGKSFTVYNGIDLSRFIKNNENRTKIRERYGIAADEFLFINVGRLTPAKDQINLLEAFAKVDKGRLMIAGQGELENELAAKIRELGLTDKVILIGAQSNVVDFYNAADCFVFSSAWEGFGIVLVEAMACELPVITTDAGGCAEVVDNPYWVVPVRNSISLASKMSEIYNLSYDERLMLGIENRLKAERFDITEVCNKWEEIYRTEK